MPMRTVRDDTGQRPPLGEAPDAAGRVRSGTPPYERVVGLHQAQQALAAVLTARTSPAVQPLSGRELLTAAVIAAVKRHRSLVHSPHSVYATELAAASQQVDAALAALAAHDFDAGEVVTA